MADVTLSNQDFLNRVFIEQKILEITNPLLDYAGILPAVRADAKSVKFKKETVSPSSDTKKKVARRLTENTKYTYVEFTDLSVDSAILTPSGFAMRVSRDAVRFAEGVDEIQRGLNRIGYWLAEDINTKIASKIQVEAAGPTTALGTPTVWSAAGANPVIDLLNMEDDMVQIGYPYRLTDVYLHKTNYRQLLAYMLTVDAKFGTGDRNNNIGANSFSIPALNGITCRRVDSGMAASNIMGLDRNNPAGTFYYNLDPKYSSDNVEGLYFNVNLFENEGGETTEIRVWADWDVAVMEPKAAIYGISKI